MVAQRNVTPPPDSQAYKDLPAVSVSCVLPIQCLFFFTHLFCCRSLVLAAIKAAAARASAGNSPTFGSQELGVTRYVNAMCFTSYMPVTSVCL